MAVQPQLEAAITAMNDLRTEYSTLLKNYKQRIDDEIGAAISGSKVYVDNVSGDDTNDGSQAAPFATFAKALASCTGNTLNIIYLAVNQIHTTARGAFPETKAFTGNTTILVRRYGVSFDDTTNFPTLRVVTEVKDGKDQASQMVRYTGSMTVLLDDLNLDLPAPATPLGLDINRNSWLQPAAFGAGQPFNLIVGNCRITTATGGLYLFNANLGTAITLNLNAVDLDGPQQLIRDGSNCGFVVGATNITTTGTKIATGTIGENVTAPAALAGYFA